MKILITGPFGNVGKSVLRELIKRKHDIIAFDVKNTKNEKSAESFKQKVSIKWGDLRNYEEVKEVVDQSVDVIIHLAAIIPPLADKNPELAYQVNVNGTKNILKAIKGIQDRQMQMKLIYTSSISIYGDRRNNPFIQISDPPNPNREDVYARQKLLSEVIIQRSNVTWSIFRLSYIVSPEKLELDPLMFEMPLETCIEVCHTKDVGIALVNALKNPNIWGNIYNIAGGSKCRIVYRDYLHRMLDIFGLNGNLLPPSAFSSEEFHCGFMDTEKSQNLLQYQNHTLEDYFEEVKKEVKSMRIVNKLFPLINRPIARKRLLNSSPYYNT
ncbi:MAG: hypothetical protein BAJALOKI2v1_710007 [Promethearchaeota archaeon]|nr:MAG: hypothetical protein BAJALOKI2v1_710007 [Candidatus Lokiarchaeota archaeon]